MKVIMASVWGMCMGVRRALQTARTEKDPTRIAIYGELVHNADINQEMQMRGYQIIAESEKGKFITAPEIMITAHGISQRELSGLAGQGKRMIDTTCPLVKNIQNHARKLHDEGYHVIVLGKVGHVEVKGITGDLENYSVVSSEQDVRSYPCHKLGVLCQSTFSPRAVPKIMDEIQRKNPESEIYWVNTICEPTKRRQQAVIQLANQVDCLVVVGGKNSNNTRELVELGISLGLKVYQVESSGDISPDMFYSFRVVGLTAGTSTPDWVVEEIRETLMQIPPTTGIYLSDMQDFTKAV